MKLKSSEHMHFSVILTFNSARKRGFKVDCEYYFAGERKNGVERAYSRKNILKFTKWTVSPQFVLSDTTLSMLLANISSSNVLYCK